MKKRAWVWETVDRSTITALVSPLPTVASLEIWYRRPRSPP